jgi:O-antigen/teichoic acid export membrane protein
MPRTAFGGVTRRALQPDRFPAVTHLLPPEDDVAAVADAAALPSLAARSVPRNALLAVAGLLLPVAVAVGLLPVLSRALGPARFGLLGLAWATLEYLTLADVGLGRSTVRAVADRISRGVPLSDVVNASMLAQGALGVLAGGLFAVVGPMIARAFLPAQGDAMAEAIALIGPLALNLPAVLLLSGVRCTLEGAGRFGLANALRIPSGIAGILVPTYLATQGASLPLIFLAIAITRFAVVAIGLVVIRRALPGMAWAWPSKWDALGDLFGFGGWIAVSSFVNPLLVYFDRFALGATAGLVAVGAYTAPYEGVTRMLVLPAGVLLSLFPAISALEARGERPAGARLAWRAAGIIAALMAVPCLVLLFGREFVLHLWLGGTPSADVASALAILAVGVWLNAIAHPLSAFVQGTGRADLTAKFHLLELAWHLPVAWWLVSRFGVVGAASAWSLRVSLDAVLLAFATRRLAHRATTAA